MGPPSRRPSSGRSCPTAADAAAVQNWLKASGFKVTDTPANRHFIAAQDLLKQVEAAFQTTLNMYRASGQDVRAPSTTLSVPASIAGMNSVADRHRRELQLRPHQHRHRQEGPTERGIRNAPPLSTYSAQFVSPYAYPTGFTDVTDPATAPWTLRGYTPAQIKGAYGIGGAYNGAGQTVAVIDAYASPTILQDVNQWSTNRGLPTFNPGQFKQIVAPGVSNRPRTRQPGSAGLVRRRDPRHRGRPRHGA